MLFTVSLYVQLIRTTASSDVTDGGEDGKITPADKKCKNRISVLVFFWVSAGCCFPAFFGGFSGDLGV